jgi:putative transposase
MRSNDWGAKAARTYKATTNSHHTLPVAPNLLEQNFTADALDQKWTSDITSIWTEEGWLYSAALVCDALTMALWRRHRPKDMIVHADRGSQYVVPFTSD